MTSVTSEAPPPTASSEANLPEMTQPDGRAALDVRRDYLKRRRAGTLADRGVVALWVVVATIVLWLSIVGFTGLDH